MGDFCFYSREKHRGALDTTQKRLLVRRPVSYPALGVDGVDSVDSLGRDGGLALAVHASAMTRHSGEEKSPNASGSWTQRNASRQKTRYETR